MPKFYLRRLADTREQITRLPLGGAQPHTVSITDAAVQKDFYTINRDGYEPDEFEKFLSELETEASSALARALDGEQWPPSPEDRYSLSCWIALQFLRGEATRQSGEETYRAFAKLEVGTFTLAQIRERLRLSRDVTDDQVEAIRARMLATADDFPVDHHDHLQQIAQSLKGMTNLAYYRRPWVLVHFKVKSLGTSDTPLTLVSNREDSAAGLGTGLGTAAGLYMPVSRRFGLYMGVNELRQPRYHRRIVHVRHRPLRRPR